jgi:outer membrane protein OmpA-like peptidoglycan-associated protein
MKPLFKSTSLLLSIIAALILSSCAHTTAIPVRTMEFEPGMRALADNLAEQLEKSSVGNLLNKVVVNPLTKQSQLKKIVIDPFIDTDSGYPVKINPRINGLLSGEIAKRFAVTGEMAPENLEISEYVLTGMVSLGEVEQGRSRDYKVYAAVFEKSSGVVHASSEVHIDNFDTTPMDIYKDSPVYLKGQNYEAHVSSVKTKQNETVAKGYHDNLSTKSMRVKGDTLYEKKDYKESLSYYNKAADSGAAGQSLEVLNGLFTNLIRQGRLEDAGPVYGDLLRVSIGETNEIASKITFGPNSKAPLAGKAGIYNIFMKQIAQLVGSLPDCRVKIIGHSSRTGSEGYNDKLSLQRASTIQKQMASFSPKVIERSEAIGRGFHDNIVGTGKDDVTDEIDRRVEFKFTSCSH